MAGEQTFTISASLLRRIQERDAEGWSRLVQLYGPIVYGWARGAGLEPNAAADIVQETFRSVLTSVGGFRREGEAGTFGGWLRTIALNKVRDHARRTAAQGRATGGTSAHEQFLNLPEELEESGFSSADGFNLVRRAAELVKGEFEAKTWEAFWQTTIDGRRADVVAEQLGMSVGGVYTAKCRVLRRLRSELATENGINCHPKEVV